MSSALIRSLFLSVALVGCGSSTTTGTGGTGGTGSTSSDLSGNWDLIASSNGRTSTGSVVLSSTQLVVTIGSDVLSYKVNGSALTATWTDGNGFSSIPLTRKPNATSVSYGAIPLALDGTWSFGDDGQGSPQIIAPIVTGGVSAAILDYVSLPDPLPQPEPGEVYLGLRTSPSDSIFGDLGGEWTLSAADESPGCVVSFEGSTFIASCDDDESDLRGDVQLTFDSTLSTASGTSSGNVELSAKRR